MGEYVSSAAGVEGLVEKAERTQNCHFTLSKWIQNLLATPHRNEAYDPLQIADRGANRGRLRRLERNVERELNA